MRILLSILLMLVLSGNAFAWLPMPTRAPEFQLAAKTTLVPTRAVDGTPTFTRATTASCFDFEGKMKTVPSGGVCLEGARMVRNLISTKSEDFSNAAWSKVSGATATVSTITFGNQANSRVQNSMTGLITGDVLVCAVDLKGTNEAIKIGISEEFGAYSATLSDITLTSSWRRYTHSRTTLASGTHSFRIRNDNSGNTIDARNAQCEVVSGQANQNPSEYVSVGVLSAPFHGAGIDGLKYFSYENGNTVASNVVTEAQGSAIADTTLKGFLAQSLRTNSVFQARNFATTWADTDCAGAAGSCEAQNKVGIDGVSNTAWTLTDDNAAGVTQWGSNVPTIANDNAVHTCSVYVKKDTDTTRFVGLTCDLNAGTVQYQTCHLNTQTGAVAEQVDTGSNDTCSATITPDGLWWRLQTTATNNTSGNTNIRMFVYPAVGIVIGTANVAATGSAIFDQAQVELNSTFASSPIVTTTAAVTRNADVLTYAADNYDATKGTALATVSSIWGDPGGTVGAVSSSSAGRMISMGTGEGSSLLKISDGTTTKNSGTSSSYQNNPLKVASSWGSVGLSIAYNNTAVVTGSFDGSMGSGALAIGSFNGGTGQWNGNIKNVKLWKTKLPNEVLKRLTNIP